ncbi:homocysteine S-methyltransferase family protein [Vibrio ziniensis]|uniref:Homocysteine S-methyltransferase family protein n=1 Tax=Vibrio ziniensis TaxID=2711221 RepID=A0A6G7CPP5_9VIBR|nr:homocysteine S-methyltransferase family protein [Vibrio ziniensis]QIH44121.1 homocysteine S-methyltransferase family protein [Vibrio ziniensis]
MAEYRHALPQLKNDFFMTDGGLETTLIYLDNCDLPYFAAFLLLQSDDGRRALRKYFNSYAEIARKHKVGLILETPTWRSNPYWGGLLGYDLAQLERENRKAVSLLLEVRKQYQSADTPIVISGCIGPRGDGYVANELMSSEEAQDYHDFQIQTFSEDHVDMVTALTLTYSKEAIGIAKAAKKRRIPVAISFTVETDGCLPSGETLSEAIMKVDSSTDSYVAYYMINCAHPEHFQFAVNTQDTWVNRIRGLRANASKLSHAELNESEDLDDGDPIELARNYAELLKNQLRGVNVVGGCCGTDHRHIDHIVSTCLPIFLNR